ncbi:hypothetical protein ACSQ67_006048 [Phaseolus vulgaris]
MELRSLQTHCSVIGNSVEVDEATIALEELEYARSYLGSFESWKLKLLSEDLPKSLAIFQVLDVIQIDENNITGSIPLSFANLNSTKHFHMNNNLLSGRLDAVEFGVRYAVMCKSLLFGMLELDGGMCLFHSIQF